MLYGVAVPVLRTIAVLVSFLHDASICQLLVEDRY